MSHTTLKSPKKPRPGSFEGHEILQKQLKFYPYIWCSCSLWFSGYGTNCCHLVSAHATYFPRTDYYYYYFQGAWNWEEPSLWKALNSTSSCASCNWILLFTCVFVCCVCVYVCLVCVSVCMNVFMCFQLFGISGVFTSEFFFLNNLLIFK
jgi:hypothetical protein